MKNIIWLASYPKSGNTWLRAFISGLIGLETIGENGKFANFSTQCNARNMFATAFAGETPPETEGTNAWRRPFQRKLSEKAGPSRVFCKTHCRYSGTDGEVLFATDAALRAILVVRNPIDVCASLTNHFGVGVAVAIDMINNPKASMARNSTVNFETPLGDWSSFNRSWLAERDMPLMLLRYEDMFFQPEAIFPMIAKELFGITDTGRIEAAMNKAAFGELQGREQRFGFDERPGRAERFFWKGRPWHGLEMLSRTEQRAVWAKHRPMAEKLGYHWKDGKIETSPLSIAAGS